MSGQDEARMHGQQQGLLIHIKARLWPTATDIVPQQNVCTWGLSGSRLRTFEMTRLTHLGHV
jgi:hypothetical protein